MGLFKQLLGGAYGSHHGQDSHGGRHDQRHGRYPMQGDTPANATPQQSGIHCNACGASQAAGSRYCGQCGTSLVLATCPQCKAALAPGASFCGQCGVRVQA